MANGIAIFMLVVILIYLVVFVWSCVFLPLTTMQKIHPTLTRRNFVMHGITLLLLLIIIFVTAIANIAPEESNPTSAIAQAAEQPTAALNNVAPPEKAIENSSPVANIGYQPEQFRVAFNALSEEADLAFHINPIEVKEGINDTFTLQFSKNQALIGQVSKGNGYIESIISMSSGDGSVKSGSDILLLNILLIRAINPNVTPDQAGKVVLNLFELANKNHGESYSESIDDIKYSVSFSEQLGVWFSVDPESI